MKIEMLYEDDDLLVCVKPQGMPAQSDKSLEVDLLSDRKTYLFEKNGKKEEPYLAMIHRLDRPVGGIMIFAKNKEAAASLSRQMQDGEIYKYYQAILTGTLKQEEGTLVDYMVKDAKTNTSKIVKEGTPDAKKAELSYEVLDVMETDEGIISYVLIALVTGRHHQIRVQLANQNAGIWGDTKYNKKFQKVKKNYKQIGLYCTRMELIHPSTGKEMVFKCEPEGEAFELLDLEEF